MVICGFTGLLLIASLLVAVGGILWFLPRNSRWRWKLPIRIAAGVFACASALTLLLFLFSGAMCGRYDFPPISSDDGKLTAQVSEEDCGALDSFHSSVQLWRDGRGSLHLFGKRQHSNTVFAVGHDPRLIELGRKNNRRLLIRYPSDSHNPDEFRCQSEWEGIQIECVGYAPNYSNPVSEMPPVHRWFW